jgi:hypothetical protein
VESVPEPVWNIVYAIAGALAGGVVTSFWERRNQSLQIRAKMIEPVEEWVDHVNRVIQIVGDDLVTLSQGLPLPANYSFEERHAVSRKLAEDTSKVLAILESRVLQTLGTRKLASQLGQVVEQLNTFIQGALLPADLTLIEKGAARQDLAYDMGVVLTYTTTAKQLIQQAHILISKLKTRLY